jgi:hypothetical protein
LFAIPSPVRCYSLLLALHRTALGPCECSSHSPCSAGADLVGLCLLLCAVALIGMNAEMMSTYIEFCADRLLDALGHQKIYRASNPFEWCAPTCLWNRAPLALVWVLPLLRWLGRPTHRMLFARTFEFHLPRAVSPPSHRMLPVRLQDGDDLIARQDQLLREARGRVPKGSLMLLGASSARSLNISFGLCVVVQAGVGSSRETASFSLEADF